MDNALLGIGIADIADAESGRIGLQRRKLLRAFRVGNRDALADRIASCGGRQIMVGHGQCQIGPAYLSSCRAQPFKGLRAGHFMHQMAVDKDQASAIIAGRHDMRVPDFLVERAGLSHMLGLKAQHTALGKQGYFKHAAFWAFSFCAPKAVVI